MNPESKVVSKGPTTNGSRPISSSSSMISEISLHSSRVEKAERGHLEGNIQMNNFVKVCDSHYSCLCIWV